MRIGIIGLGLIGGSLARDLVQAGHEVVGYDDDEAQRSAVQQAGPVQLVDRIDALDSCAVVVLATPVDAALALLPGIPGQVRLITDVCSTKRSIVQRAEQLGLSNFVGSHPLAGDHRSGWSASIRGLFAGARVFICASAGSSEETVCLLESLWSEVGALPERMSARAHDELLAVTSHLPQVLSTALALALQELQTPRAQLGPGGREMTRLAGSHAELWRSILLDNRENVLAAMDVFVQQLDVLQNAIAGRQADQIRRLMTEGNRWMDG